MQRELDRDDDVQAGLGLVFLSGLAIPILAVTGVAMWLLKRRSCTRPIAASLAQRPAAE